MLPGMEREKRPSAFSRRRDDGAATRQQVLEAAGEVFAEKGFGRTTGKEIAERAGTNSAAVNYYFGGIDGLYAEVLIEARHRLIAYEFLKQVSEAPGEPREKLDILVEGMVRAVLDPASSTWPLRVLGREILTPSPAFPSLLAKEVLPKKQLAAALIGEILGIPPDHPAVARCGVSIIAPFILLLVGSTQKLSDDGPTKGFSDVNTGIRHFQSFIAGGLAAIAAEINRQRPD